MQNIQGSPAIDLGTILKQSIDYDGRPVRVGKSADIGVFEFGKSHQANGLTLKESAVCRHIKYQEPSNQVACFLV